MNKRLRISSQDISGYLLNQIHRFINLLKRGKSTKGKIRSFKLKGQFDNVNIRQKAYE